MKHKHILLIEDEADMAELVSMRLRREGFEVSVAEDGVTGQSLALSQVPDLVLLDLMLPLRNGLSVLRTLREDRRTAGVPVIIVSARGGEGDVVAGLQLGADDYITKPFSLSILVAKVSALLRRVGVGAGTQSGQPLNIGPVSIDVERHSVEVDGGPISLTKTEFRLLVALVSARGRVLTRSQLIDQAIGQDVIVTDRTIDVHLTGLRSKLGNARKLVRTVRGVGYQMDTEEGALL